MTIIAFCLGLAIGIGIWLWRRALLDRYLRQIIDSLQNNPAEATSLPTLSRLRRAVVLSKQEQQKLLNELETWRNLLQSAPMGFLLLDEENQLLWCNEQARELLQLSRWEPGQLRLLLELVRCYELDRLIEKTRTRQQPLDLEWVFHPAILDAASLTEMRSRAAIPPHQPVALRASSVPLPYGQVGVFLENRQPIVELSKARDRWVSDLAHELRTPLTSIRLVAEALQKRVESPLTRWVEQLLQETTRLINLVQDFLELSHLEEDPHKHLHLKPVELGRLIQSVWQTLEPFAEQKQLGLIYSEVDDVWVQADESRLTQVFLNLFDNSIKYSPTDGIIQVEVNRLQGEDGSDRVQINIIDSGAGFDESDLPHIFDRLYRGDTSRQRQASDVSPVSTGSGLGLAIVRQIILAHGGSAIAQNHPESGGAWLQLELPSG